MMKRDLKAAFRHIPINPYDYWLLLFEWNGQFFVDTFLPFGLRTAPRIFNLFAEALHSQGLRNIIRMECHILP
jgi:hypothetical protein